MTTVTGGTTAKGFNPLYARKRIPEVTRHAMAMSAGEDHYSSSPSSGSGHLAMYSTLNL